MRLHQLQLGPGHDILDEIEKFFDRTEAPFAAVLTAVGSLSVARIRPAVPSGGVAEISQLDQELEIVSLAGVLARGDRTTSHLHIAVSDSHGSMTGGHLKSGSLVRLGAKIVLGTTTEIELARPDPQPTD